MGPIQLPVSRAKAKQLCLVGGGLGTGGQSGRPDRGFRTFPVEQYYGRS